MFNRPKVAHSHTRAAMLKALLFRQPNRDRATQLEREKKEEREENKARTQHATLTWLRNDFGPCISRRNV